MGQRFGDSKGGPDRKRTLEKVLQETQSLIDITRANERIIFHKQATLDKEYTREAFHQACLHYKGSQELGNLLLKFSNIIESRLNEKAYHKEADSNITKFNLINHYGREDKKITENKNTNIDAKLSKEEEKLIKKAINENN